VRQDNDNGFRQSDNGRHPVADEALDWFMRLQEERDPETLAAFERWRGSDPLKHELFAQLSHLHAMPALRQATLQDAKRFNLLEGKSTAFTRRSSQWLSAVSAIAATLIIAVAWHHYPRWALYWQADYLTATGEHKTITLPDGSSVTLNTASAITTDFKAGHRNVVLLQGEAFFDVKHDPAHPFIVSGHFSEVVVKGTAFDVQAASGEDVVVLERGSVDVSRVAPETGVAQLKPDQMIVATASGLSPVQNANIAQTLAWREGRIIFHDRPFLEALHDLDRYYSGTVITMAATSTTPAVSGNYRIDDPESAIRTLAASAGLSVTRLPGSVLILR